MENIRITLDIDPKNKNIHIGEDNSSGTIYQYEKPFDMVTIIRNYIELYHSDIF